MLIQVKDATPTQLNWLAAEAKGLRVDMLRNGKPIHWVSTWDGDDDFSIPNFCFDSTLALSLVREHRIGVSPQSHQWTALRVGPKALITSSTDSILEIAVVRCFVLSELGEEHDVPENLK